MEQGGWLEWEADKGQAVWKGTADAHTLEWGDSQEFCLTRARAELDIVTGELFSLIFPKGTVNSGESRCGLTVAPLSSESVTVW